MSSLAGKTLFITGASRGIGRAIGLRAAQDGANIVIAAKTIREHSKLPGTIYDAASEFESAGGAALAVACDIRDESDVEAAVQGAVKRFGGIDILINNASALSLTGTLETSPRVFDRMFDVNARGSWLCTRACLPHLLKADNPHVLNIAPPINLEPRWFAGHSAYTFAKYAMSVWVLGMAEEFREQGVAVNALWPVTAIATAAVRNLLGGEPMIRRCRHATIMADAARAVLVRDSRSCTGNFYTDEQVLNEDGVQDFDAYAVEPGQPLLPDFFL
ncbi:short chain dehydrogenase [bacterium]|nr:MAG: short chain dehydrogenase [bacterium]